MSYLQCLDCIYGHSYYIRLDRFLDQPSRSSSSGLGPHPPPMHWKHLLEACFCCRGNFYCSILFFLGTFNGNNLETKKILICFSSIYMCGRDRKRCCSRRILWVKNKRIGGSILGGSAVTLDFSSRVTAYSCFFFFGSIKVKTAVFQCEQT